MIYVSTSSLLGGSAACSGSSDAAVQPVNWPGASLLLLGPLGAVLGPALAPIIDAGGVLRAADDVVAHAGQVLHAAAAHEHDAVLLQVVALAGDVGRDLDAVGQPHAGDLAQRRVGLLRRLGVDARADALALRAGLQGRALALLA